MTGILLIDKPSGPTSHDVVARLRQVTRERSMGHAGTLDPRATGLLVLVLGQATRLVSMMSGRDKTYDATIRLGFATTTDDADGTPLPPPAGDRLSDGPPSDQRPSDQDVESALDLFRGSFDQQPPQHSAKKVDGHKAYDLARRDQPVALASVPVTVRSLEVVSREGDLLRVRLTASAGFYVRALARDLGDRLGCGAHLDALRRVRSGSFDVASALPLAEAERLGEHVAPYVVSASDALSELPSVRLSEAGLLRATHGNPIAPQLVEGPWVPLQAAGQRVRLLDGAGRLVALAESRGGVLHPVVVLG